MPGMGATDAIADAAAGAVIASGDRTRSLLCAALLAAGRPLTERDLAPLLGLAPAELSGAVAELDTALRRGDFGIEIEHVAGGYRLVVAAKLVSELATLLAPTPLPPLSNAAIETLALVAYHQPVTRGELEVARGASCVSTLETLQERDLIRAVGHKEVVGRPLMYATTERFLVEFGLASLDDLPPMSRPAGGFLRS